MMTLFGEQTEEALAAEVEGEIKGDFDFDFGVDAEAADEEGEIKADLLVAELSATVDVDLGMLTWQLLALLVWCLKAIISTFSGRSPSNVKISSVGTEKLDKQRVNVNTLFSVESIMYLIFDLSSMMLRWVLFWK